MTEVKGKVVKFDDNINTDVIIPGRYLIYTDPFELAKHAMEGVDPSFPEKAKQGCIIVAGKNFGCGSSREQAPVALKYAGVKAVVAESFARIFYRNAINIGLPALTCRGVHSKLQEGDEVAVNLQEGTVKNLRTGEVIKAQPLHPFVIEILTKGGLISYMKAKLQAE
ncbi:MAG: 3-isopropylmalate dehydratase small subunit [Candidatus Nezhaarchaeales archaeon]